MPATPDARARLAKLMDDRREELDLLWQDVANASGLSLTQADRMGFVPVRAVLSVRDLPRPLVAPVFAAGERALDAAPWLAPLSDYKLLLFTRTT